MIIVAWFVWITIWGAAGYFTVRTIQMHRERRRIAKEIVQIREFYSMGLSDSKAEEEL